MDRSASRRRFLALTATGVGLSVAGCSGLGDGGTDSGSRATLIVQIDQEALQSTRTNVTEQAQAGEINQSVALQQIRTRQQELLDEAVATVEAEVESGPVTIEERKPDSGAFLVSGPGDAIVDFLSNDSVGALFAPSTFEDIGQSAAPPTGSTNQTAGG